MVQALAYSPVNICFYLPAVCTFIKLSQLYPNPTGEYPWQVAILKKEQYDNVYVCGGSLIDGTHLITAAHCIAQYR